MTAPGPTNIPDTESPVSTEDLRLAVRAATLYYLDGLTQAEVAQRLGVSRPTAGRLVARARAQGLVRIEVSVPPTWRDDLHAETERALEERYELVEPSWWVAGSTTPVRSRTPRASPPSGAPPPVCSPADSAPPTPSDSRGARDRRRGAGPPVGCRQL